MQSYLWVDVDPIAACHADARHGVIFNSYMGGVCPRRSAAVNPLFELLVADNVSSKDVSSFFAAVPGDINVDALDSMGYSCLGLSIEKGLSLDVIKVLVQEGFADVNLVQHGTQSILQMACSSIRAELVEYLLSRKQTWSKRRLVRSTRVPLETRVFLTKH
jgi:hypothetical protein